MQEKEVGIPRGVSSRIGDNKGAPYASDVRQMGDHRSTAVRAPKSSTIMATTSGAALREAEDGDRYIGSGTSRLYAVQPSG